MPRKGSFRSHTIVCVVCGYRSTFRVSLPPELSRFAGNFRRALPEGDCPKCAVLSALGIRREDPLTAPRAQGPPDTITFLNSEDARPLMDAADAQPSLFEEEG